MFPAKNCFKHKLLAIFHGPGGFRELREACRNNFAPILVPLRLYGAELPPEIRLGEFCFPSTVQLSQNELEN